MGEPFPAMVFDAHGPILLMVRKSGYVMCRRKHCSPLVLREDDWLRLPQEPLAPDAQFPTIYGNSVQWVDPKSSFRRDHDG